MSGKPKSSVVLRDRLKYEIAEELGLLWKVEKYGWSGLSAEETGRIGGILSRRIKQCEAEQALRDNEVSNNNSKERKR